MTQIWDSQTVQQYDAATLVRMTEALCVLALHYPTLELFTAQEWRRLLFLRFLCMRGDLSP